MVRRALDSVSNHNQVSTLTGMWVYMGVPVNPEKGAEKFRRRNRRFLVCHLELPYTFYFR